MWSSFLVFLFWQAVVKPYFHSQSLSKMNKIWGDLLLHRNPAFIHFILFRVSTIVLASMFDNSVNICPYGINFFCLLAKRSALHNYIVKIDQFLSYIIYSFSQYSKFIVFCYEYHTIKFVICGWLRFVICEESQSTRL